MNFNFLNLMMAGFWLLVAVMIFGFSRNLFGPANEGDRAVGIPPWLGFVALGGVLYNLFRWRMGNSVQHHGRASRVNPLAVRRPRNETEPYEKNPDFDFIKLPDADPPRPSVNGDHLRREGGQ